MIVWEEEEVVGCVATVKVLLPLQNLRIKHCTCLVEEAIDDERFG
jgi:hypothetical protein